MKRIVLYYFIIFCLLFFSSNTFAANPRIITNPVQISVAVPVTFSLQVQGNQNPPQGLYWDFGDGSPPQHNPSPSYSFKKSGPFTVTCKWEGGTASATVSVSDNRKIESSPARPRAGREITFKALGFHQSQLKWHFGDGQSIQEGATAKHVYLQPGNYKLKVYEAQGDPQEAKEITLQVAPDNRSLTHTPREIFVDTPIEFRTKNIQAHSMQWDFDDNPPVQGGTSQTHTFQRPGKYTIKVMNFGDKEDLPVTLRVQVLREDRRIEPSTGIVFVDSPVEFKAINFRASSLKWNWDDGSQGQGGNTQEHTFKRTGSFKVQAWDFGGKDPKPISCDIKVQRDTRELKTPRMMLAGESYRITLLNAKEQPLEWRFSSGQKVMGSGWIQKIFSSPGVHTITIKDPRGDYPSFTGRINIQPDGRHIESHTRYPLVGDPVKLAAVEFQGPSVDWTFRDGIQRKAGALKLEHSYREPGHYTVSAIDMAGDSKKTFTLPLEVVELTPGFKITQFEITFSDGKYYKVIPVKSSPPPIQVRIKATGRGILRGKWLWDHKTMRLFSVLLQDKQSVLLKGNKVVKLPVNEPGIHSLSVEFTNFQTDKELPELSYFVTTSGAIKLLKPRPGIKLHGIKEVSFKWSTGKKPGIYEIAISRKPFQFLGQEEIQWQKVGNKNHYEFTLPSIPEKSWFYWQVREIDHSGEVITTSEIASFKVI